MRIYCLGLGKTQEIDRLHLNPYDGTRVQYHDPITAFPEKMDELLIALNKVKRKILYGFIFLLNILDLYGYKT
jgi:hypothetical protein